MDCTLPGSSVHRILHQEHWSGLPFPPQRDLPDPGIEPTSLMFPALVGSFCVTSATCESQCATQNPQIKQLDDGSLTLPKRI